MSRLRNSNFSKKIGISVDMPYHHTGWTSASSEPFQTCRAILSGSARQTWVTLTNTNKQQVTQSDIKRQRLSSCGWTCGPTFPPSLPAEPGKPCSPGTPGAPGWPRSPVGPDSPDLPWSVHTILDQPCSWKYTGQEKRNFGNKLHSKKAHRMNY